MYLYLLDHAVKQIEQMVAKIIFSVQLKGGHYKKSYKNFGIFQSQETRRKSEKSFKPRDASVTSVSVGFILLSV